MAKLESCRGHQITYISFWKREKKLPSSWLICGWASPPVSQEPINTNRDAEMPSQNDRSNGGSQGSWKKSLLLKKTENRRREETSPLAKVKSNGIQKKSNQDKNRKKKVNCRLLWEFATDKQGIKCQGFNVGCFQWLYLGRSNLFWLIWKEFKRFFLLIFLFPSYHIQTSWLIIYSIQHVSLNAIFPFVNP